MRVGPRTKCERILNAHDDMRPVRPAPPLRATLNSRLGTAAPCAFTVGDMAEKSSICFVACVESGPLEVQTVRLAEGIRRFGGALADSEILTITPRFGPPLSGEVRRRFRELDVRHERLPSHPRYAWYHYLNTPIALAAAEELTTADILCWTDSDLLFLGEPTELLLDHELDFIAGSTDNGVVGTMRAGL